MQNVSEEFKQEISQPSREIESRITFPDLVLDDYQIKSISLNSILVGSDDFEIGTAPMDMVKVELVEDTGDEWGRNLFAISEIPVSSSIEKSGNKLTFINNYANLTRIKIGSILEVGKEYTISFKVKLLSGDANSPGVSGSIRFYDPLGESPTKQFGGQGQETISETFVLDSISENYTLYFYASNTGVYEFKDIKIEKGPVATPWTPAPEDYANYDYKDKECEIELGLTLPDESVEYVSIGKYTVENAVRKNNTITLDCVDRMYKAEKGYVSDLMYPTTILDILESACDQAGIELATTTFANSDYIVPNEPVYEDVTCRKVFAQVAELAGGYAKINRQGQLEIVTLGNESVRDITKDHYFDLKINEVAEASIEKVIVKVGEETATKGDGENIYTIVDNMFVQDPNNVVGSLYNVLKNVSYTACSLKWQGDFSLDLGDKVTVDGHDTYILDRSLKYTGGLRETYRAPAKSNIEKESTGKRSLTLEMANYKSELRIVKEGLSYNIEKVERVEGDLGDLADRLEEAEFKIEPGQIVQTVRQSTAYQGDLDDKVDSNEIISSINQTAEQIKIQANKIELEGLVTANSYFKVLGDGSIEAKGGIIGGWGIVTDRLMSWGSDDDSLVVIAPPGSSYPRILDVYGSTGEWKVRITKEGVLQARGAEITGNLTAESGTIGGLTIESDHLTAGTGSSKVWLGTASNYFLFAGSSFGASAPFRVTRDGSLRARNADITGSITSSTISSSTITGTTITGGTVRTSSSGDRIQLSDNLLRAYKDGVQRVRLDTYELGFYEISGAYVGGITGDSGGLNISADYRINLVQNTVVEGWLQPSVNNAYSLGGGSSRWSRIFLQYNPDVASDIRLKSSIQNIPNGLLGELKEIQPKMYQQGEKWHFGYVAQDVERALYKYALKKVGWEKAKDYAREFELLHKDESYLSLIYAEIAVLKEAEMQARIDELEARLLALEQTC